MQNISVEPTTALGNLTQLEYLALNSSYNLSDGHARQELTEGQARIIADLPKMWVDGQRRPVDEIETEAQHAYFELLGQHGFPGADGRVLSCYSSSVAMEIFARSLATTSSSIALVHPTFDNIPDILRGVGLDLVRLDEDVLHDADLEDALLGAVDCVFITTPNNPTGVVLSEQRLRRVAEQCAEHGVVLTLDTSFRGFDTRAHYDHYAVLESSGCRWVVIEDTGKLWPTQELKIGFLVTSANIGLPIAHVYSDILLGVSPLVMAMVRRFSEDAADGGLAKLHEFIADNRATVRAELLDVPGVSFPDADSRASVERIDLGSRLSLDVWSALREHNVYMLPCQNFHWADPSEGDHSLRIALSRPKESIAVAAKALRAVLQAE